MDNDKRVRVVLPGRSLWEMYHVVGAAVPVDRFTDRALQAADTELAEALKLERPLEGGIKCVIPKEPIEVSLSSNAVFGLKAAFVQIIVGSREKSPLNFESRRMLLDISATIGRRFLAAVRKDSKLDEEPSAPAEAESLLDEELVEAATG